MKLPDSEKTRRHAQTDDIFRVLFDQSPQGMVIIQGEDFKYANIALSVMTGYQLKDLMALKLDNLEQLFHPEDCQMIRSCIFACLSARKIPAQIRVRMQGKLAEMRWMELHFTRMVQGDVPACMISFNDITRRKETEKQLRNSEERFRIIVENSVDPVLLIIDDRIVEANAAALKMLGGTEAQVIGLDPVQLSPEMQPDGRSSAEKSREMVNTAILNGSHRYEWVYRRFNGETFWVEIALTLILIEGEAVLYSVWRDITVRKRTENIQQALYKISQAADTTEHLEDLYSSIQAILGELMPTENFYISVSHSGQETLSFPYRMDQNNPPSQPIKPGKGLTEYVLRTGKSMLITRPIYERLVSEGEVDDVGFNCLDWIGVPLRADNQTIGVMVLQTYSDRARLGEQERDILDFVSTQVGMTIKRKRAEDALEKQRDFLRLVIDIDPNLIFTKDHKGRFTLVNQAMAELYGTTVKELVGKTDADFNSDQEQVAHSRQDDQEVMDSRITKFIPEEEITDAAGKTHTLQTIKRPILDANGNFNQMLGVATDISERKQREHEMEAVASISAALRKAHNLTEMQPVILNVLTNLLEAEGAALAELDPVTDEIIISRGWKALADLTGIRLSRGKGITSDVITNQELRISDDIGQEDPFLLSRGLEGIFAAVCAPLSTQIQTVGALWVLRRAPFNLAELRLIVAVADIAANAIHRAALFEQTEQRLRRVNALHQIDLAISSRQDLKATLAVVLEQVIANLNVDAADVLLLNQENQTLTYATGMNFRDKSIELSSIKVGEGLAGQAALQKCTLIHRNISQGDQFTRVPLLAAEEFISYCCVPLIVNEEVNGILEVYTRSPLQVNPDWLEFLEVLAGQVAIAVDNAHLFTGLQQSNAELRQAYDATIEGWARALELRDKETLGHSERVTDLTLRLAKRVNIPPEELEHIRRGALLHDIGKMGVRDDILLKPRALTDEDWEEMHQHPLFAYNLLSKIEFLHPALDIPYSHHEKWDGSGYPRGLKGEEIPLAARIFTVVDVWDALTKGERPYRETWAPEETMRYIQQEAGKQFDPDIVKLFIELMGSMSEPDRQEGSAES